MKSETVVKLYLVGFFLLAIVLLIVAVFMGV